MGIPIHILFLFIYYIFFKIWIVTKRKRKRSRYLIQSLHLKISTLVELYSLVIWSLNSGWNKKSYSIWIKFDTGAYLSWLIIMYVCMYVSYTDSLKGCKFFWKVLSFYTHTLSFIGTALSTVVNWFRFDSWCRSYIVAPHLKSVSDERLYSRGSHVSI